MGRPVESSDHTQVMKLQKPQFAPLATKFLEKLQDLREGASGDRPWQKKANQTKVALAPASSRDDSLK